MSLSHICGACDFGLVQVLKLNYVCLQVNEAMHNENGAWLIVNRGGAVLRIHTLIHTRKTAV